MIQVNKPYVDAMDPSRTVVPVDEKGNCRVYFDGNYAGNAKVPPSLFDMTDDWKAERVGFNAPDRFERQVEERTFAGDDDRY